MRGLKNLQKEGETTDHDFNPAEIEAANDLISGRYHNFVLVRATLDGQPVSLIVAILEQPGGDGVVAGYVQPIAVIVNNDLGPRLSVDNVTPTEVEEGSGPDVWRESLDPETGIKCLTGIGLTPNNDATDFATQVNLMADHGAKVTGGLTVHSTEDGRWCAHLGPEPEDGQARGCTRETFLEAMSHAVTDHAPAPGNPLLAPDDPRATSYLN